MSPVYILLHSMDNSLCHDHQMIKKLLDAYSTLKNLWVDSEQADLSLKLSLITPSYELVELTNTFHYLSSD